ncbi:beta-galactosidase, partial [Isoptericola sp. QY 916]|uniref:beta-galactosidase n=1 Tax=Isoptericola sp. QY 916 TaxID=2782570 RepID=UPI003D300C8B|nr:beta-galactosidase [Isoptericola sp. QY 916]
MTGSVTGSVVLGPSGLVVDGEEKALLCASLFSFRLPREEWAARLAQVRATGYDAVDVYLPWNFHELEPGRWDFTGRRDVGTFLDLAHEAGLLVVARPGPYICSEWDGGALPAWLTLEPGLRLRQAEPRYLARVREWFDQVLPILAARQHGRGGSVVAVQLENELDFFDCDDRAGYVGALAATAREHGITVPLVACAGQGDLVGATGGVDGVAPAFNFYPDDRSPHVEAEVRRYADLVADRGLPLLVTETNRRHVTLRRLLVSGATLLAPYLQASGFDLGYTPSVGNWGDPGSFMTHDYDFGGFLSPVGAPRPETAQARVLAAVVRTLGPALARG